MRYCALCIGQARHAVKESCRAILQTPGIDNFEPTADRISGNFERTSSSKAHVFVRDDELVFLVRSESADVKDLPADLLVDGAVHVEEDKL